jgi:hypothetical protein
VRCGKKEITQLLKAEFINKVLHPEWWQIMYLFRIKINSDICVDYSNINKAYPKVPFSLPWIDQIVDFTSGCDLFSFMDYYS